MAVVFGPAIVAILFVGNSMNMPESSSYTLRPLKKSRIQVYGNRGGQLMQGYDSGWKSFMYADHR
ncbi:MAG: hypothetical protein P8X74_21025 [Reinekea sp.]